MWDLIVSVPDHCLSFYFRNLYMYFYLFQDDLKDYISDLMYKSVDFHAGEHTAHKTLKPS